MSPKFHCIYDNELDTRKRDAKFKSLWQHKAKLTKKNVELSGLDALTTKPPDSLKDAILPNALYPPQTFFIEWETPLAKNYKSSDNHKILYSVPTLPT